jgi:RNA polymerase primary sigma factor
VRRDKYEPEAGEESDDVELDLSPGTLEKTNDPVRMYLREMGTVPLLTREGEVEIAKRIERGQMRVMKAISRSPIVIREIVGLGEDLKRGVRNIKEVVTFDEEELTEEILQARVRATVGRIDEMSSTRRRPPTARREARRPAGKDAKAKAATRARPLAHGPRACLHQPHRPRAEVHQRREEAAARQGQQDRRLHAHARAPDQEPRRQVRGLALRRAQEGVQAPAEELPHDLERVEADAGISLDDLKRTQREMIQGDMDAERPSAS